MKAACAFLASPTLAIVDLRFSAGIAERPADDGGRWSKQTSAEVHWFTKVSLGHGATARFVRLRTKNGASLQGLTEMSVWPTP